MLDVLPEDLNVGEFGDRVARKNKKAHDDEEEELEEPELVDEEDPGGWEIVEDVDREVEEDEDEEREDNETGEGVDETTAGDESPDTTFEGETTAGEVEELPGPFWRLCNQCRFSSMS